jgi:hypothetical protein
VLAALVALALSGTPSAELTVTVWPGGRSSPARVWTLRCGPVGGTLPGRARACARLGSLAAPFAATPGDAVCTQIYGGPQEALVRGSFRGRKVWTRFSRRAGCAIGRWNRVAFLFPVRL